MPRDFEYVELPPGSLAEDLESSDLRDSLQRELEDLRQRAKEVRRELRKLDR